MTDKARKRLDGAPEKEGVEILQSDGIATVGECIVRRSTVPRKFTHAPSIGRKLSRRTLIRCDGERCPGTQGTMDLGEKKHSASSHLRNHGQLCSDLRETCHLQATMGHTVSPKPEGIKSAEVRLELAHA